MSILFIVLFVLIIVVYILLAIQNNPKFDILNVSVSKINPHHLFEKLPIVIREPLVKPMELTNTLFKYLYIRKSHKSNTMPNVYQQNKSKYVILYPREMNTSLQIVHPNKSAFLKDMSQSSLKNVNFVEVLLNKRQAIILPMYWWYNTNTRNFGRIELDDTLSLVFGRV